MAQLRRVRARLGGLERDGASRGGARGPALDGLLGRRQRLAGDVRRLGNLLELEVVAPLGVESDALLDGPSAAEAARASARDASAAQARAALYACAADIAQPRAATVRAHAEWRAASRQAASAAAAAAAACDALQAETAALEVASIALPSDAASSVSAAAAAAASAATLAACADSAASASPAAASPAAAGDSSLMSSTDSGRRCRRTRTWPPRRRPRRAGVPACRSRPASSAAAAGATT